MHSNQEYEYVTCMLNSLPHYMMEMTYIECHQSLGDTQMQIHNKKETGIIKIGTTYI